MMARQRIFDHDRALTLWQQGETLAKIGSALGVRPYTVMDMITRARRRGDPRAERRLLKHLPITPTGATR